MDGSLKLKTVIKLKNKEKIQLEDMVKKGVSKTREVTRARVLLLSDENMSPTKISEFLRISFKTIQNIKERYCEGGLNRAIKDAPRSGQPTKFNGKHRANITALACTKAPEGFSKWSLQLLADKAVELGLVEKISHTHVGRILKKTK